MNIKRPLFKTASASLLAAFLTSAALPVQVLAAKQEQTKTQLFKTANSQLYQAQQLLDGRDDGDRAYELLRDLLKNDDTINEVSRRKIQKAADSIESFRNKGIFTRLFNNKRFEERPFLKARHLLAEAIMDSRVALNESSDSEVIFVEKLLSNFFFPGHGDKVVIHYPSASEFAFKTWAYTRENMFNAKVGESTEDLEDSAQDSMNSGNSSFGSNSSFGAPASARSMPRGGSRGMPSGMPSGMPGGFSTGAPDLGATPGLEGIAPQGFSATPEVAQPAAEGASEQDWLEFIDTIATSAAEVAQLNNAYNEINHRIKNRYLYQSMLMQAIAEPGSALLDPQLQEFLKAVRIEVKLGQTDAPGAEEISAYKAEFGEGIVKSNGGALSIDLSKLYGLDRPGTISNLELQLEKEKDGLGRASLSVISSVSGEDLMFLRFLQVAALGVKEGPRVSQSNIARTTVNLVDKIFDGLATFSNAIKGNQVGATSNAGSIIRAMRGFLGSFVKFPSKLYDLVGSGLNSKIGKKISHSIKTNEKIQSGKLMQGLVALAVAADLTTAVIEYQYLETGKEKRELVAETSARIAASATYLLPVVGQVAGVIDLTHLLLGTSIETADFYRGIGTLTRYATLAYYGHTPTTISLGKLEFKYRIPRDNVHLQLHGAWIENKEDAQAREVDLFLEMEEITRNNLVLLYRAHRQLDRGANSDFGERIYVYSQQYDSNLEVMKETQKTIKNEMEKIETYN